MLQYATGVTIIPCSLGTMNFMLLKYMTFSSFFPIRPFSSSFDSSFSWPRPAVTNKKVSWLLEFTSSGFLSRPSGSPLGPFLWLFYKLVLAIVPGTSLLRLTSPLLLIFIKNIFFSLFSLFSSSQNDSWRPAVPWGLHSRWRLIAAFYQNVLLLTPCTVQLEADNHSGFLD